MTERRSEVFGHVVGTPRPQPRVRAYRYGKSARVYTPDSANEWKNTVGDTLTGTLSAMTTTDDAVVLMLEFIMPRPKTHYRTGKNAALLRAKAPDQHKKKPDVDNLLKGVADVLTDVGAWADDTNVVAVVATKRWAGRSELPGCLIRICYDRPPGLLSRITGRLARIAEGMISRAVRLATDER